MANSRQQKSRREVAAEAARIIASNGTKDFLSAKRKAAAHLGISDSRFMPGNIEIKAALSDYQNLFQSKSQPDQLRALRTLALWAMEKFSRFQPRLVGDVLEGIANEHSEITVHLFADTLEEVALFLLQKEIPHQTEFRRLRVSREHCREYPALHFFAEDHGISLVVFPLNGIRQAPFSSLDGKPMRRASLTAVQEILASPA